MKIYQYIFFSRKLFKSLLKRWWSELFTNYHGRRFGMKQKFVSENTKHLSRNNLFSCLLKGFQHIFPNVAFRHLGDLRYFLDWICSVLHPLHNQEGKEQSHMMNDTSQVLCVRLLTSILYFALNNSQISLISFCSSIVLPDSDRFDIYRQNL